MAQDAVRRFRQARERAIWRWPMASRNRTTDSTLTTAKAATSIGSSVMMMASQTKPAAERISGTIWGEPNRARQSMGGAARPFERNRVTGLML